MYALKFSEPIYQLPKYTDREYDKLVHKGVSKNSTTGKKAHLTFQDYKDALFEERSVPVQMRSIRSFGHNIFTVESQKSGLAADDNKRYLVDNLHSLSYGHYKLRPKEEAPAQIAAAKP